MPLSDELKAAIAAHEKARLERPFGIYYLTPENDAIEALLSKADKALGRTAGSAPISLQMYVQLLEGLDAESV